ncbi:MAG: hypothetical protein JHC28_02025 [Thermoprotei archaeon]|nr:hypothetical protein [Thermoprotei archaeon]
MSRKEEKDQLKRFFLYQIPFFAIGLFLIALGSIFGVEKNQGLVLFIAGASVLVLSPSISLYILVKIRKKKSSDDSSS